MASCVAVALRLSCLLASAAAAPALLGGWPTPLRQSKAVGDDTDRPLTFVATTGLAPYPGYEGNLSMTGDIFIMPVLKEPTAEVTDRDFILSVTLSLFDADQSCAEGVTRIRVAGSCSVSVHTGNTCEEAGEAYSAFPRLPYTTVNRSATSNVWHRRAGIGESDILGAVVGRTVVVRDATGTRVACAPLRRMQLAGLPEDEMVLVEPEQWQGYPGYAGELRVVGGAGMVDFDLGGETGQLIMVQMGGADPECTSGRRTGIANSCGIHVHEGRSCTDAATIGGHFYNRSASANGTDPWAPIRYVTQDRGRLNGAGAVFGALQTVMTGLAMTELEGRALVVHDAAGARIACALVPMRTRDGNSTTTGPPTTTPAPLTTEERAHAAEAEIEAHEGNPCKRKPDGWQCHDDVVVQCSGGRTVSSESCPFYQECKEGRRGWGSASCEEDVCADKADGLHCKDDRVVECSGLRTVNFTECAFYQECERDQSRLGMAACVEDECDQKADGFYCEDDHVIECRGQRTVNATKCGITQECKKNARGWNMAACVEDDCHLKPDGTYCKHDGVVECVGQVAVGFSRCPFYQECKEGWQAGARTATCQEDACEDMADGWHCKGDHLVQCSGLVTVDIQVCPMHSQCEESWSAPAACV